MLVTILLAVAVIVLVGAVASRLVLRDRRLRPPLTWWRIQRQFVTKTVRIGGIERFCLLYVPTGLQPTRPIPLVFAFHGGGGDPRSFARVTRLHYLAETEGFLLAYPAGTGGNRRRMLTWNPGGAPQSAWAKRHGVDDVGFVKSLLNDLSNDYLIDRRRVFAIGASKGGMLAYHLACTMSETFAAVAVVAGSMISKDCAPRHPVAILHVHGGRDEYVPLRGGKGRFTARGNVWPPVEAGLEFWRRHNGCAIEKRQTLRTAEVICWRYAGLANGDVEFCLVRNGGHTWPGRWPSLWQQLLGVRFNGTFSTNQTAWRFFLDHAKPEHMAS